MEGTLQEDLSRRVKDWGYEIGFDLVGVSDLDSADPKGSLLEWLRQGYAGEMEYMARTAPQRIEPGHWLPWARSVVCVGLNYAGPPDASEGTASEAISRYAVGRDYHMILREKLEVLLGRMRQEVDRPVQGKICVDSSAVLEKALGSKAGLGWMGKNTLLISPKLGSYLFLGELFVDLELAPDRPMRDRCGGCRRCLDSCPTQAFVGPYLLDARRCISYLTIELKGPIPRPLRRLVGAHIFGCDRCQEVCPYNVNAPKTREHSFLAERGMGDENWISLFQLSEEEFQVRFRESPILRAKRRGLLRNVAIALGNSHDPRLIPTLQGVLEREKEPLVRGHVAWALGEIGTDEARRVLKQAELWESDSFVLEEIRSAIGQLESQEPSPERRGIG
jgi:epoxyqueuosine reductase